MVIAALRLSALPLSVVTDSLPAVEKVRPALAMMVPAMVPPPAPLMVAADADLPEDVAGLGAVDEDHAA